MHNSTAVHNIDIMFCFVVMCAASIQAALFFFKNRVSPQTKRKGGARNPTMPHFANPIRANGAS